MRHTARRTCPKCFAYGYHMPWCSSLVELTRQACEWGRHVRGNAAQVVREWEGVAL